MNSHERFRPYAKYSVADGLGRVPAHWRITRLKYVADFFTGWTPPSGDESYYDGDYPWANISDLNTPVLTSTAQSVSRRAISEARLRVSPKGSLLFSFKLSVGLVSIAAMDLYTNEAIATLVPGPDIDVRYLYWAAPFFLPKNANENIYGAKLLNRELMRDATLLVPPSPEQRAIVTFLDRETARIDALIAKQERLLALLEEKRTALVTHAVTKGLDPKTPMKESGLVWIGAIPSHWDVVDLARVVDPRRRITYGIVQPGEPDPNGILMIRGQDYSNGWADASSIFRASPSIEAPYRRSRLRPGDIVLTIVGAGVGNVAVVPNWLDGANLTQTTARIAVDSRRHCAQYFSLQLQSLVGRVGVELAVRGAAQPTLTLSNLGRFKVAVPPVEEQAAIARYLEEAGATLARVAARAKDAIALLREYRTALISAAVTGQIDVSGGVYGGRGDGYEGLKSQLGREAS